MKSFKYLYRELLRQQKISGIVFGICGALCVCAVMLIYMFARPNMVPALLFNPYAYFLMIAGGTTFPLVGFSYLNKRNSADIFHSFPASRLQLFLATAAASATWIVALNLLTYIASLLGYLLVGTPFSWMQLLCQFLSFNVGALCIMAGTMVAIGITGTTLSALLASLVINYVPRFVLTAFAVNAVNNEVLCFDQLGLLSPHINFAFGSWLGLMFDAMFGSYDATYRNMMAAWFPIGIPFLYTLLLTVLLTALAAWLFIRRHSETAGHAATSKLAQHIVRCGVAAPFIIGLIMTYDEFNLDLNEPFFWIVLLGALAVYVVYELVSVRSFKKMLKSLPLFVGMTVALLLSGALAVWGGNLAADRTVAVEDIKTVSFTGDNEMYPMDNEYTWAKYGRLEFDNEEVKALTAAALQDTVAGYASRDDYPKNGVTLRVKLKTKTGSFSRYIKYDYTEYMKLLGLTCQDPQVETLLAGLPSSEDVISVSANCYSNSYSYSDDERKLLWDTAVAEYQALTQEQKVIYHSFNGNSAYGSTMSEEQYRDVNYSSSIGWVRVNGVERGREYSISLHLNAFFPKTVELMYQYAQNKQEIADVASLIARADAYLRFNWNITCYYPNGQTVQAMCYENVGLDEETLTDADKENFKDSYVFLKSGESLTQKMDEVHENWDNTGYLNIIAGNDALLAIGDKLANEEYTTPGLDDTYYSLTVYTDDPGLDVNYYYTVNFRLT